MHGSNIAARSEKMVNDEEKELSFEHDTTQYSMATENRARRKVDLAVLLPLFLGLLVFQFDRMNLASALTGGLRKAIGVDQYTINLGNQMMFLGIVVLEIPSNMLLQKIGPRIWISTQVVIFGFIAVMQIFIQDRNGFLIIRSFLGLAEAGYIPGACFTLSIWYTREELAKRVAVFFFGMFGGNALSPLLASGILKLDGRRGIAGWQWIFLIEGLFTVFVGLLLLFVLPGSPDKPSPVFFKGIARFSAEEQVAIQKRLEEDGHGNTKGSYGLKITGKKVWKTVCHYRRWPHFLSTLAVFSTWSPLTTYTPTIFMSLGFDRTEANALASIGGFLSLLVVFIFAFISDRTNKRGLAVILAQSCYLITLIVLRTVQPHAGKWGRFGLWTAVNAFAVGYHPVHNTWVQLNCLDPAERSISIAMWVMSAITGLMIGTQYFQAADASRYETGSTIMIGLVAAGISLAVLQEGIYYVHNKRVKSSTPEDGGDSPQVYVL